MSGCFWNLLVRHRKMYQIYGFVHVNVNVFCKIKPTKPATLEDTLFGSRYTRQP